MPSRSGRAAAGEAHELQSKGVNSTSAASSVAYAHSLAGRPPAEWEDLEHHLREVAARAAEFAGAFGAAEWGCIAGSCHDLGKYSDAFQQYIRQDDPDASEEGTAPGRVDHSTFGAQYVANRVGRHAGWILAYCVAGHHAGLPDGSSDDESTRSSTLIERLKARPPRVPAVERPLPDFDLKRPALPFRLTLEQPGFQAAFFARMLFSALVDADRLATEAFCDADRAVQRAKPKPTIEDLAICLERYLTAKQANASPTEVNQARAEVLAACQMRARLEPGFFSLNVPTGGGKTLSSLAFALRHAHAFDLRRIVVAIPYTSIIDQTADEYRKALGPLAALGLVEHHSAIEPGRRTRENDLAAENWDAPLIVTTNVQLFESLFAARTTPCRKLHRLARSVIVLDEAQTIPVELLRPTLAALKELVNHYGCTVVLSTATQPALERRSGFDIGIENVRPIIDGAEALFARLERVELERLGKLDDDALAERVAREPQALCIVNSRGHAARLFERLVARNGEAESFHLSTLMCAEHRRHVLSEIRRRVKAGESCRVVSTQLVEAGVDLDFPVVFRAPAGFDSIAQAAGRCNREGLLLRGRVYLFESESPAPPGLQRSAAQVAGELLPEHPNPLDPRAVTAYFRQFYWTQTHRWDASAVLENFADDLRRPELLLKFKQAARAYQVIRDEQVPILVPYGDGARIRDRLLSGDVADFSLLRSAQRYLVQVWENMLRALMRQQLIVEHESGLFLLVNEQAYSARLGLTTAAAGAEPSLLIL